MTVYIGIDPGLQGTGWAVKKNSLVSNVVRCKDKTLSWVYRAHVIAKDTAEQVHAALPTGDKTMLIIEFPTHWTSDKSVASQNSGALLKLSYLCGAIASEINAREASKEVETLCITPDRWKGQLPKDIVLNRLEAEYGYRFRDHEGDAVGIVTSAANGWRL